MTDISYETVMVTGAAGFVGRHLLAHLLHLPEPPRRIVGVDIRRGTENPRVEWVACDLTHVAQTLAAVRLYVPDAIVHLAAITQSSDLDAYFAVNVQACQNLLSAASTLPKPPRTLVVGSAAQYGITSGECEVIDESRPLLAYMPYGVSKTLQEKWALLYGETCGLPVICVRPFNIMGPGQPTSLVPATFLAQIADVLDGRASEVRVGDTTAQRDFTDVRDVVAAMWALLNAGDEVCGRVFNISSGHAVEIRQMLETTIRLVGRDVCTRVDQKRLRSRDVRVIVGDAARLRAATKWTPNISWERSLQDMWQAIRSV